MSGSTRRAPSSPSRVIETLLRDVASSGASATVVELHPGNFLEIKGASAEKMPLIPENYSLEMLSYCGACFAENCYSFSKRT